MASGGQRNSNQVSAAPTALDLLKILECPICFEIILPPVYPCIMGHSICTPCRISVQRCPLCRSTYTNIRNMFFEGLLSKCRVSCKYNGLGCNNLLAGRTTVPHQRSMCDFRPILCLQCDRMIQFDEYLEHMKQNKDCIPTSCKFNVAIHIGKTGNTPGRSHLWNSKWFTCSGHDFFLRMESDGFAWWIFVSIFGSSEVASKWGCKIRIFNPDKKFSVSYNGPLTLIRSRGFEAEKDGTCITLTHATLGSLVTEHFRDLNMTITISPSDVISSSIPPAIRDKPLSPSESMCSEDMPDEHFVQENEQEEREQVYQNVIIPLYAMVSVPQLKNSENVKKERPNVSSTTNSIPPMGNGASTSASGNHREKVPPSSKSDSNSGTQDNYKGGRWNGDGGNSRGNPNGFMHALPAEYLDEESTRAFTPVSNAPPKKLKTEIQLLSFAPLPDFSFSIPPKPHGPGVNLFSSYGSPSSGMMWISPECPANPAAAAYIHGNERHFQYFPSSMGSYRSTASNISTDESSDIEDDDDENERNNPLPCLMHSPKAVFANHTDESAGGATGGGDAEYHV